MPTLFSFADFEHISASLRDLSGLKPGRMALLRHANQEWHADIQSPVAGEHCFILGSIAPPDGQMLSLLLLAHTLRLQGAARITGLLPYLAYAREDKIKPGQSLATQWAGALLHASALDEVWSVDVHSEHDRELLPLSLESISPARVFGECLEQAGLSEAGFVAPDEGAVARCEAVQSACGKSAHGVAYFQKQRTASGITHHGLIGRVQRRTIVVDDVLDTGATLVSACQRLVEAGAEELYICVTHGLFTGARWRDLWSLPVKRLFCTDTVPACASLNDSRITTLSVGPLLRAHLAASL
ncbi:MAG TPA: ribose-phosphate diphosphokinase [Steroidobacteraceae bacterium]|nr:ribose-phosphate diphosphokinase [Steroidobacteraceae bacterium]